MSSVTDQLIPTYLFSFVAGKFSVKKAERSGRTIKALYRETDPDKVAQLDKVFDIADHSIRWFERYTGIPLPLANIIWWFSPDSSSAEWNIPERYSSPTTRYSSANTPHQRRSRHVWS